jgi:hypothetical protein
MDTAMKTLYATFGQLAMGNSREPISRRLISVKSMGIVLHYFLPLEK